MKLSPCHQHYKKICEIKKKNFKFEHIHKNDNISYININSLQESQNINYQSKVSLKSYL